MEQDMQNKNPGNTAWKDKLEDAGNFTTPGLLDKNAAWDKLHQRLHKRKRTIPSWYRIAAACFLLAIMLPFLLSKHKKEEAIKDTSVIAAKKQIEQPLTITKENVLREAPSITSKKKIIDTETNRKNNYTINKPTLEITPGNITNKNDAIPVQNIQLPLPVIQDNIETSALQTIVAAPVKKKLKVVHVNELGDSEDKYNRQPHFDYSLIQFGIREHQPYNNVTIPANNIGVNISTGKNNPSN